MKKQLFYRILFYAAGLLILALGLTLNTKHRAWSLADHLSGIQHCDDL